MLIISILNINYFSRKMMLIKHFSKENSETYLLHKDSSAPLLQNVHLQLLNLEVLPSNNLDSLPDFNVGQKVDLQEVQEANDIQCALQDLFMTAIKTPKVCKVEEVFLR